MTWRCRPEPADVVDQHVQPRVGVEDLGGQAAHLRLRGEVGAERVHGGVACRGPDLDRGRLRARGVAAGDRHPRPERGQPDRGGLADAAGGAGDQDRPAGHRRHLPSHAACRARDRLAPGGRAGRAVRPGQHVGDHRDEPEAEDPGQQQPDEPRLAREPRGVEQGPDPGHDAGDEAGDHRRHGDDPEADQRPGQRAATEPDDVGAVHHEEVVGDGDPHGGDAEDGAGEDGEHAADEEPGDDGLGHDAVPFQTNSMVAANRLMDGAQTRDGDLAAGVSQPDVIDRLGGLAQRIGPIDDRSDLAGLDELLEDDEVGLVLRDEERPQRLAGEARQDVRADHADRRRRTSGSRSCRRSARASRSG